MKVLRALAVGLALTVRVRARPARRFSTCRRPPARISWRAARTGSSIIWSWLYGYYADQDADPIIDFSKVTAKGQALAEACQKTPDKDIISVAEPIYEK